MPKTGDTRRHCEVELTILRNPQKMRCREGGCGRLLHTVNSTSQCLLVSPVFWHGVIPTPYFDFYLHCPGPRSNLLFMIMPAHKMHTKLCLAQLEIPVEIVALPSESYDESLCSKESNVIKN